MSITRASRHADRQAQHTGIRSIRFVKESLTAQLSLRGIFADVFVCNFRRPAETYASEVQVLSIRADDNCVLTQCLDSIYTMCHGEFAYISIRPAHRIQT